MADNAATQPCPICGVEQRANPRYPHYLCAACVARLTAPDGRAVQFFNASVHGGCIAVHRDDGTRHGADELGKTCMVDGIMCWADEARFGGIVVQPVKPEWGPEMGLSCRT